MINTVEDIMGIIDRLTRLLEEERKDRKKLEKELIDMSAIHIGNERKWNAEKMNKLMKDTPLTVNPYQE